jgi:predicted transcriptional regulator of viral defense system
MGTKSPLSRIGAGPVTAKELEGLGLSRSELERLLADGEIVRLGRGVYQLASNDIGDENQFRAATKRIRGRTSVCTLSALAYYNLTDEIPKQVWLMVGIGRKSNLKDVRLFRTRNPHWNIGVDAADGYKITSVERTIVDCLSYQHKFGNLGVDALKRAIKDKKTTLNKIADIAERLGVGHKIAPIIQVLS